MPRRANTQTQQETVQENAAVQANAGADMQLEAAITKTQPEKGVLALADVKIGDFMTIRNVRIKEDDYGLTVAMPKTKAGANEQYKDAVFFVVLVLISMTAAKNRAEKKKASLIMLHSHVHATFFLFQLLCLLRFLVKTDRGIKERFDQTVQKAYETFMHQQTDLDEETEEAEELFESS